MSFHFYKKHLTVVLLVSLTLNISCGQKEEPKQEIYPTVVESTKEEPKQSSQPTTNASEKIDLVSKGVGPIKTLELADIDSNLAQKGADIFKNMCTACHKPDKKFIGPAPKGILQRRTPEWVMNMILNPEIMIQSDLLAKELLIEFNGAPMANQNLTEEDARAVLEYFRTL